MAPVVYTNKEGFTLIEVMVAILIMLVGIMGLLQSVNIALVHNMASQLRNDAVAIADEQMAFEMVKPFDLISTTTNVKTIPRTMYNGSVNYTVTKTGAGLTTISKSVNVGVAWTYRNQNYNHSIGSYISKTN